MKNVTSLFFGLIAIMFFSCGGGGKSQKELIKEQSMLAEVDPYESWQSNHGIGPVKAFELPVDIDQTLAASGQAIFDAKCTACHKLEKKFIGPSPKGVLTRRTPAWVMNMIMNPDNMILQDPIAKKLLMESNGSPMANQNLTEEEARSVLEYFRTL
jgi:cytochrome c